MADAIVSMALEQLTSIIGHLMKEEYNRVSEVTTNFRRLSNKFESIQAVLVDAEQRQYKEKTVKVWLDRLKNKSYDIEDLLDKWTTRKLKSEIEEEEEVSCFEKVCSFFLCRTLCFEKVAWYHEIGKTIEGLFKELDDIGNDKDRYHFDTHRGVKSVPRVESTSSIIESEIFGRDEVKNTLVGKLVSESSFDSQKGLSVISIVGMGGIGKTTLAQLAYNSKVVKRNFDMRGWVCVSDQDQFDALRVASLIAVALRCPTPTTSNVVVSLESISEAIRESIVGKKILLVLDDVWTKDRQRWEPIIRCLGGDSTGSKVLVLVTTRNLTVGEMMGSTETNLLRIENLSEEHCWSLFKKMAFFGRDLSSTDYGEFSDLGRQIVRKCKGLPLAAKTMGGVLRCKLCKDEWFAVLNDDMWNLEGFEEELFPALLLSYNDLPHRVKSCFLYCAIFPKDYHFDKDRLIKLWMAQGYLGYLQGKEMERTGEEYFNMLASRSFFQEFQKDDKGNIVRCKMHDIVHDCAIYLTRNECLPPDRKETSMMSSLLNARHVMLMVNKISSFRNSLCKNRKLRSLFFQFDQLSNSSINQVLQELFGEGMPDSLRALELGGVVKFEMPSGTEVKRVFFDRIPSGIGKLIHLRYLDLSENDGLDELPEILCELYNLQTLNIALCRNLQKLPFGIGKLVNLRHLINNGNSKVRHIPKGIEKLTCLRTLCEFRLSGSESKDDVCTSLDCLNNFEYIRGYLLIGGLENLRDKLIDLHSKEKISDLALEFDGYSSSHNQEILAGLQPPLGLQSLEIHHYNSSSFSLPDCIMLMKSLKKVKLHDISGCEHLPPFGKLPSLESLEVHVAKNVRRVGYEFLGIKKEETKSPAVVIFPKLKSLHFVNMPQWEEWSLSIRGNEEEQFKIMPSLHSLSICSCRALRLLPNQLFKKVQLKNLEIVDCPLLEEHYKATGRSRSQISHIPNIRINNTGRRSLL